MAKFKHHHLRNSWAYTWTYWLFRGYRKWTLLLWRYRFLGGCGRLFEGSPAQMDNSINNVIRSLGDDVSLYPAHEYSLANLEFAKSLYDEPQLFKIYN